MNERNNRDADILDHIIDHCEVIERAINRFGSNYEIFLSDEVFRDAVSMNIFQIGELAKSLSNEFVKGTQDVVPWKEIKGMRDHFAHGYGNMNKEEIWRTATDDVPALLSFCKDKLREMEEHSISTANKLSIKKQISQIQKELEQERKSAPGKEQTYDKPTRGDDCL